MPRACKDIKHFFHHIWKGGSGGRKGFLLSLIAGPKKLEFLNSPMAKVGICLQSKHPSVRSNQSDVVGGGLGPGNPPSFSLLPENFKLLCKFSAATVSDVFGVAKCTERVWREQKRQANAITQVAAAISCLISIINTRHRQRTTGNRQLATGIQSQINSERARNPMKPQSPRSRHVQQSNNGHKSFHMPNVWSMIGRLQQLHKQE